MESAFSVIRHGPHGVYHHASKKHNHEVVGDQHDFVSLDSMTKLIPSFRVGKRDAANTWFFKQDPKGTLTTNPSYSLAMRALGAAPSGVCAVDFRSLSDPDPLGFRLCYWGSPLTISS